MVNRKERILATAFLVTVAFASSVSFGQGFSARISGVVRDASGALVPGVTITVKQTDNGSTRTVVTNETGAYSVPALPVGPYEITADLAGFKKEVRRGINLVIGQEAVVNLTIEVGGAAE